MDAKKSGVAFTKAELRALREFSSKEPTDRDRFGVQIQVEGERVYARATNSRICIEMEGISDGKLADNEWFVDQKFLIDGRKLLEGKQVLRLKFKGASLYEATVEENGVERDTLTSASDAAVSKPSFPAVSKTLKKPNARREKVHCMALAPAYLYAATLAAAAIEGKETQLLEFFPPSDPDGLVIFQVGTEKDTSIIGGILANVTAEAVEEGEDEEGEEEEKPKRGRKKNEKQPELALVQPPDDAASPE